MSKLGLPLRIDAIEAISPCLRYSEVFPPLPHESLGERDSIAPSKVSGVSVGDSILIQIRSQTSAKWPQDINAMGAAKCAMLMQLTEGIEKMKNSGVSSCALFDGSIDVMPTYLDLGYNGYDFRIIVRAADEELKMLYNIRNPSQEAVTMRQLSLLIQFSFFSCRAFLTSSQFNNEKLRFSKRDMLLVQCTISQYTVFKLNFHRRQMYFA